MRQPSKVAAISFGLGGHGMELMPGPDGNRSHLSGYEDPESFVRCYARGDYAPDPEHYSSGYDCEGAWVVDERAVVAKDGGARIAFRAPLLDPTLPDGEVSPCPQLAGSILAGAILSDPGNGFAPLIAGQLAHKAGGRPKPGPLDSVSTREWVEYWRKHGARVGRFVSGRIEWEDQDGKL